MALGMNEPDSTMELVMKNIYSSCDPHSSNEVLTSKLIDFIMPYMLEDLSALENLKSLLDPDDKNVCVSSEEFYQVMNEWAKKIKSPSCDDFNTTPSQLDVIDDKLLPYSQSTPRASFGQKLLRCEGLLLNLSNESIYNISASTHTKENITVGAEKTVLEEEIKKLGHQLHKVLGEMEMVKMQLAQTEELNDNLHADLERCRTRLLSEQQLNEHLHKNKCNSEELKEEISFGKKRIEELNKKISNYEKENSHLENYIHKIEKENADLEERLDSYKRREQDMKKEMFDMKTELDMKDLEVASITKLNDEFKLKLAEKKNLVDQLTNENELLDYKKQGLERILSSRRYSTASSHYTTCLADESNSFLKGSPIYPLKNKLVRQLNSSTPKTNKTSNCFESSQKSHSLNDLNLSTRSMPDIHSTNGNRDYSGGDDVFDRSHLLNSVNVPFMSLQAELCQVDNIFDYKLKNGTTCDSCLDYEDIMNSLKVQNESLQSKFHELTEENKRLNADLVEIRKETETLKQKLTHTVFEKCAIQESLKEMEHSKDKTEKENNIFIDLEEVNILKAKLASRESELVEFKEKFNFESAYKSSQIDLNDKNNELFELKQSHQRSKDTIQKLTSRMHELEKSLQLSKIELQENEDKTKQMLALNHNIEQTANQVQEHINHRSSVLLEVQELNKKFQDTIKTLEKELEGKTAEINNLRNVLKGDEDIKNMMWRNHKKIHIELENLKLEHASLLKQLEDSENAKKDLKEEYNALLTKYNDETVKNVEMPNQISDLEKELSDAIKKCNEETDKNIRLCEDVTVLKNEVEHIRNNQKDDKERINKKLSDYESHMQNLEKINEQLKAEMEIERNKVKEDGISDELCNKLAHFQQILVNLETQISDLENEKEILRSELECERKKTKKDSEGDISSECSSLSLNADKFSLEPKNRSFEKQKLTIEKLRERLEHVQAQLLNEKSRCDVLRKMLTDSEEKYTKLTEELEESKHQTSSEQQSLQRLVNELTSRLKSQDDNYKKMCHNSNKKLEEISLKLLQLEQRNTNLLTDLANREALIKQHMDNIESDNCVIENLNKKIQESEHRHQRLFAELATKEIKLKTMSMENAELKTSADLTQHKLDELVSKCTQFESSLTKSQNDLIIKSEEVNALLSRICEKDSKIQLLSKTIEEQEEKLSQAFLELTQKESEYRIFLEKVSKTDDHKEEELLDTEQRIKKNKVILEALDADLEEVRAQVDQKRDQLECVSEKVFGFLNVMSDCNKELSRAVSSTAEKWETEEELPSLKMCQTLEVEESLLVLNNNIKVAISLLEILSSRAPSSMDESENQITIISNARQLNPNDSKNVKKFTLRPSRLILNRPVSPDSPSLDIDLDSELAILERDKQPDSPDSYNCKDVSFDAINSIENGIEGQSDSRLPTLPLDLPFHDAFPNVSDTFLEKLGLQEGSPKLSLSKDETEKLFTTFAIQIALDSRDIKDRLQRQKLVCARQHRKCFYLIKDISLRLRDHKCIGASDPINPVFVLLEDVRFLLQEIVRSSGQLGILTCENRMAKCWNLVTNYMAMLKQGIAQSAQKKMTNKSREEPQCELRPSFKENIKQEEYGTEENTSGKSAIVKEKKNENTRHRRNWFTCIILSIGWILLFTFMLLILLLSIHWQCRMTTDHQVCPLDDFIKKIQIGSPPY